MDKPSHMNFDQQRNYEEAFLDDVSEQITYKPLRPAVVR